MQTQWAFHGYPESLKQDVRAYWKAKAPRLERLLTRFPIEPRELAMSLYRHSKPERFEVRAVLRVARRTLAAEESGKALDAALDRLSDALCGEVKRQKDLLRGDWSNRRHNRRHEDFSAAGPLPQREPEGKSKSSATSREAFFERLRPLLAPLQEHAKHELRLLEKEGKVAEGEYAPADLTDAALLRAWERFARLPAKGDFGAWLMHLLDESLAQIAQEPREASLDEPMPPDRPAPIADEDLESDAIREVFEEETLTLADAWPAEDSNGLSDERKEQ